MIWTVAAGVCALTLSIPTVALAHSPRFAGPGHERRERAVQLPDLAVSYAVYGRLRPSSTSAWISAHGKAGLRVPYTLQTPLTALDGLRPTRLEVFGPNGFYKTVAVPPRASGRFDEPFSGTHYRTYVDSTLTLPKTGIYAFRISSPKIAPPSVRYVLAVGEAERPSPADIARLGAALARIKRWYVTS